MPLTLDQAIEECIAVKPLPEGYRITAERDTDNLLVCGPSLCFAITRTSIDNGNFLSQWEPALQGLIEREQAGGWQAMEAENA